MKFSQHKNLLFTRGKVVTNFTRSIVSKCKCFQEMKWNEIHLCSGKLNLSHSYKLERFYWKHFQNILVKFTTQIWCIYSTLDVHIAIYFNFLIINIYVCVCGIVLVLFFSFSISMEIFCFFLFFRKSEKSRPLMLVPNIFSMNNRSSYFFFFLFSILIHTIFFSHLLHNGTSSESLAHFC